MIVLRLDRVMVANVNLSKMKTGKISAVRFSTLNAICDVLDCQPGDILEFVRDEAPRTAEPEKAVPKPEPAAPTVPVLA